MQTLFIGKELIFLNEVESTNTYAMNLLRNVNVAEGAIIHTGNQTQGKGQRGSVWSSEIGSNLTISCVLKPHFLAIKNTFYLSKISALAVYDVMTELLRSSQYDIKIKWPNDILVDKKKIAGILIENNFNHDFLQHSIIGIGINVNQLNFKELSTTATSLQLLMNKEFDKNVVLEKLCRHLEKWYLKLKANKLSEIDSEYLNHLFGLHQVCSFLDLENKVIDATISSVSLDGKLELKLINGDFCQFDIKEIKMIF